MLWSVHRDEYPLSWWKNPLSMPSLTPVPPMLCGESGWEEGKNTINITRKMHLLVLTETMQKIIPKPRWVCGRKGMVGVRQSRLLRYDAVATYITLPNHCWKCENRCAYAPTFLRKQGPHSSCAPNLLLISMVRKRASSRVLSTDLCILSKTDGKVDGVGDVSRDRASANTLEGPRTCSRTVGS